MNEILNPNKPPRLVEESGIDNSSWSKLQDGIQVNATVDYVPTALLAIMTLAVIVIAVAIVIKIAKK